MSLKNWVYILIAAVLMLFLGACAPTSQVKGLTAVPSLAPGATLTLASAIQGGEQPTEAAGSGDAAAGAAVFLLNCTSCHGIQGEGVTGATLRNNQFLKSSTDQAIQDTVSNGRPGTAMPAWLMANGGPLTNSEIRDVAAYLKTFLNVALIPSPTPQPEEATETPGPANAPTPEPAKPSNTGDIGAAVKLTGNADRGMPLFGAVCAKCHGPQGALGAPNVGSDDGSVPPLNPIDSTLVNSDPAIFAANVDLFIEHGSVPDGPGPTVLMPNFGDAKILTPQQIADLLAYIIKLNPQ